MKRIRAVRRIHGEQAGKRYAGKRARQAFRMQAVLGKGEQLLRQHTQVTVRPAAEIPAFGEHTLSRPGRQVGVPVLARDAEKSCPGLLKQIPGRR